MDTGVIAERGTITVNLGNYVVQGMTIPEATRLRAQLTCAIQDAKEESYIRSLQDHDYHYASAERV